MLIIMLMRVMVYSDCISLWVMEQGLLMSIDIDVDNYI